MAREVLDELAELVADRLERRRPASAESHLNPATVAPKWTDRLANTLRDIRLRRLVSEERADVVGDQPES
jgi:hypothetical protein